MPRTWGKNILIFLTATLSLFALFSVLPYLPVRPADEALAQAVYYGMNIDEVTGDVSGYAWSDGVGWIDFGAVTYNNANGQLSGNANITAITNLGQNGQLSMRGDCAPTCGGYGVNVDLSSKQFSGAAWNDRIGWVLFTTAFSSVRQVAFESPSVEGWAWNDNIGWISMSNRVTPPIGPCDASPYNTCHWAWNDEIGWISHNSIDNPSAPVFGVHVSAAAGTVTGYAWNDAVGYIGFSGAAYNSGNGELSGTASIIGYGASGSVTLRGDCVPTCGGYGVNILANGTVSGRAWNDMIGWIEFAPAFGGVFYDVDVTPSLNGWAWNDAIGWISFNFTAYDVTYGINLEADGRFTGYAWSDNVGWINYRPTSGYPSAPSTSVTYNPVNGELSGWAQIVSMGADGWIKYRSSGADPVAYGASINGTTGDWQGYAWNDTIGWINFEHALANTETEFEATGPADPILIEPLDCVDTYTIDPVSPLTPALDWSDYGALDGSTQAAFQIMLDDDPLFASPVFDQTVSSAASIYGVGLGDLVYNVAYYWRVRVQSSNGEWSQWGVTGPLGTETNCFRTPLHPAPICSFTMNPATPVIAKPTQFTDTTQFFGGATGAFWGWNFGDGATLAGNNPALHRNPQHQYSSLGVVTVTHNVIDSDGYACSIDSAVNVSQVLPEFEHVIPR